MSTKEQAISVVKTALGTEYTVLEAWDAETPADPDGAISVDVTEIEDVHNGECLDVRITLNINGYTLCENDKDRSIIHAMEDHCLALDWDSIKGMIDGCVGVVRGVMTITCDGDTSNFSYPVELYVCNYTC